MKDAEDEAFDELAKRQGDWGGGFPAKRKMAADKLQEYDQTALELCNVCGWKTLIPGECCLNCERAQPAQQPVAFICQGNLYMAGDVDQYCIATHIPLYTEPPQHPWIWLSDADIAEVVDTTCQYTGSYEEYLIKKAERKIRSMNNE